MCYPCPVLPDTCEAISESRHRLSGHPLHFYKTNSISPTKTTNACLSIRPSPPTLTAYAPAAPPRSRPTAAPASPACRRGGCGRRARAHRRSRSSPPGRSRWRRPRPRPSRRADWCGTARCAVSNAKVRHVVGARQRVVHQARGHELAGIARRRPCSPSAPGRCPARRRHAPGRRAAAD